MTNYIMSRGRKERNIRIVKKIVIATVVVFGLYFLMSYMDKRDTELMSIDYCWDSNGQHYVIPNENCSH